MAPTHCSTAELRRTGTAPHKPSCGCYRGVNARSRLKRASERWKRAAVHPYLTASAPHAAQARAEVGIQLHRKREFEGAVKPLLYLGHADWMTQGQLRRGEFVRRSGRPPASVGVDAT